MAQHLLGIRHLDKEHIEELIELGKEFRARVLGSKPLPDMSKKVIGLLFFESSTRTRVSFEQAARYLNMKHANFAATGSSMSKGETFKDTILTLRFERLDGLVMRHRLSGSPGMAAHYFGGPVINAGDGEHEHPTQALGDALTILDRKRSIKGLRVAIVGDVTHSRVARSNAWLLSKLGAEVRFVGPRTLVPRECGKLPASVYHDLATGIEDADVIMCLRLQKERMDESLIGSISEYARQYQVNRRTIRYAAKDCLVMHPGPINRGIEVDDVAADGDHSVITAQIENGVFVRMAALNWAFAEQKPEKNSSPSKPKAAAKSTSKAKSKESAQR